MESTKPRLFSGMQPSGRIHIGNYFGALKQFVELQDNYETFIFIANLHALTSSPAKEKLIEDTNNIILDYLGAGLDPEKVVLFKQSDVPAHANLAWIFNNLIDMPFLMLAHAFKDKVGKNFLDGIDDIDAYMNALPKDDHGHVTYDSEMKRLFSNINVGLFEYPILMAADILLYDADVVPVGKDQKQHVEYSREIGRKFNNQYGEQFKLPKELILESVETIPGIDGRKMSKSYNNTIPLFGTDEEITKAVMSITTDSRGKDEEKNPDELIIYQIHKLFDGSAALKAQYAQGLGYGDAKKLLIKDIIDFVTPMRERREHYANNPKLVQQILINGAMKANDIAMKKLFDVYEAVGLTQ